LREVRKKSTPPANIFARGSLIDTESRETLSSRYFFGFAPLAEDEQVTVNGALYSLPAKSTLTHISICQLVFAEDGARLHAPARPPINFAWNLPAFSATLPCADLPWPFAFRVNDAAAPITLIVNF